MNEEQDETVVDLRDTAVGIDVDALGDHDTVLTAVANHYERAGHATQQLWVGDLGEDVAEGVSAMFDLYVEDLKLLVEVETLDTLMSLDPARYAPWREAGYRVMVVAPKEKLAHVARREANSVDEVVGWSADGPKVVLGELIDA